ncbi:hypothetical protein [Deinococcus multiflagellatus]|uniref:Uncharacterized protein n=1 Tax=Deinococcus multiflagellatus TaxID=1656887 RepID=A0ABW1ZGE4_9DEIO|nr:hypothetical protein [Deinococcus multiflagellatus]MBZ9712211.1 hypothetical protein [Deinococcus multiflagellatus]
MKAPRPLFLVAMQLDSMASAVRSGIPVRPEALEEYAGKVRADLEVQTAQARRLTYLHQLAVEASRTDSTGHAVRAARDELVRAALALGGEGA